MEAIDPGKRCVYPECGETMADPDDGRMVGPGELLWLCPRHEQARWTPAGDVLPQGARLPS